MANQWRVASPLFYFALKTCENSDSMSRHPATVPEWARRAHSGSRNFPHWGLFDCMAASCAERETVGMGLFVSPPLERRDVALPNRNRLSRPPRKGKSLQAAQAIGLHGDMDNAFAEQANGKRKPFARWVGIEKEPSKQRQAMASAGRIPLFPSLSRNGRRSGSTSQLRASSLVRIRSASMRCPWPKARKEIARGEMGRPPSPFVRKHLEWQRDANGAIGGCAHRTKNRGKSRSGA